MIGISRTMNMVLHGRHITSREAQDYGISNKIVSSGTGVCIFFGIASNKSYLQVSQNRQVEFIYPSYGRAQYLPIYKMSPNKIPTE